MGGTEGMSVDGVGGPAPNDPVPPSYAESVLGLPISTHVSCPTCPGVAEELPSWGAPHGSCLRPSVHLHLMLHVRDNARDPPARLLPGDGTCQAPTHAAVLAYAAAMGQRADERAGGCGRCTACCFVQPVHPCPDIAQHDLAPPWIAGKTNLQVELRELAVVGHAKRVDGGTLPMSIARHFADDPVALRSERGPGCQSDCDRLSTVRKTRSWCHEDGRPPAFVLAVLGRFGGCVRDGRVGTMKNMSRVRLAAAAEDSAVTLVEGQRPYAVEIEVQHTQPYLASGHWVASARFADELRLWDDATTSPLAEPLAAQAEGQSHLYAVLYRHVDVQPPSRRPRPLINPTGRNWCPFNVTLITIAATWHVLGPGLRKHGPVTRALDAVMSLMFDTTAPAGAAVGTLPRELGALEHFTGIFFDMSTAHVRGGQLPMCEVWIWLVQSLRTEHYAWRNVAFYRGYAAAEPAGFSFEDLCRPFSLGDSGNAGRIAGKAGDYEWLGSHHGWVQWAFPTALEGQTGTLARFSHGKLTSSEATQTFSAVAYARVLSSWTSWACSSRPLRGGRARLWRPRGSDGHGLAGSASRETLEEPGKRARVTGSSDHTTTSV